LESSPDLNPTGHGKGTTLEKLNTLILKKEWLLLFTLLLITIGVRIYLFSQVEVEYVQDGYWYAELGKNLVEGKGYSLDGVNAHKKYLPLFPELIALTSFVFHDFVISGKVIALLFGVLLVPLTYYFGRKINPLVGLVGAFLVSVNHISATYSVFAMTETLFTFLIFLSIYLFKESVEEKKELFPFSMIALALAGLTKYEGMLLLPLFILYLLHQNENKIQPSIKYLSRPFRLTGLLLLLILWGGWFLRNYISLGGFFQSAYIDQDVLGNLGNHAGLYYLNITEMGWVFAALILIGFYFLLRDGVNDLNLYLLWSALFLLVHAWWPWAEKRWFIPVLPAFACVAGYGLSRAFSTFKLKKVVIGISLILLAVTYSQSLILIPEFDSMRCRLSTVKIAGEWADENLGDGMYVAPDRYVYGPYLEKENLQSYVEWLNPVFLDQPGQIFIFADNYHTWLNPEFFGGKDGSIRVALRDDPSHKLLINTDVIRRFEGEDFGSGMWCRPSTVLILEVDSMEITEAVSNKTV
jgi:hypothetical protein